tara:strand:+ start:96 stop:932 length:837 start_codon:yes stop_codon:yes gene_type:complete
MKNLDEKVIKGFGDEWKKFNQDSLDSKEHKILFSKYFNIFPFDKINEDSVGFDMGCGSGRWAKIISPSVKNLHCVEPSFEAMEVAKQNLGGQSNIIYHLSPVGECLIEKNSMDFGYSLGVLHHIPDTRKGIRDCVDLLKKGSPFLVYLYYSFDNKPIWFRFIWVISDQIRKIISKLPFTLRYLFSQFFAFFIYFPLARSAYILEKFNFRKNFIDLIPLSFYRNSSFYTMRTDALDRFGTSLERRFTKKKIEQMMKEAGLKDIKFSENAPFWVAVGFKN